MEGYIGEIRFFAGNFVPLNWQFCNGQSLDISRNTPFFRVIGFTFGGDGRTRFNLPDLRRRAAVGTGQEAETSNYALGDVAGTETVTLTDDTMPSHQHPGTLLASSKSPNKTLPGGNYLAKGSRLVTMANIYAAASTPLVVMNKRVLTLEQTGNGGEHNNMQPFLACNFIICVNGIFPSHD